MLNYIKFDTWIWRELVAHPTDVTLFIGLVSHRNIYTNETNPMKVRELAELVGISRMEVYRCIDRLKSKMLIEEVSNKNGVLVWKLVCLEWKPEPKSKGEPVDFLAEKDFDFLGNGKH